MRPSGKCPVKRGCAEIPVHHKGHWWPPSAGQIAQETVIFFAVPISSLHIAKLTCRSRAGVAILQWRRGWLIFSAKKRPRPQLFHNTRAREG